MENTVGSPASELLVDGRRVLRAWVLGKTTQELQMQGPQEEKGRADGALDREVNFRRVEFVGPVSWWGMKVSQVSERQEKERAVEDPDSPLNSRQGSL